MRTGQRFATGISIIAALLMAGCGGESETSAPRTVTDADLQQDRAYWLSIDDALRRELAGICQSSQAQEATSPQATLALQDLDTDDYVAKINVIYEDESATESIEVACEAAKQEILSDNISDLAPQLQQGG